MAPHHNFSAVAVLVALLPALALPAGAQQQPPPASPPLNLPRPNVAADPARPHVLPPTSYLPVTSLKAGMKGYGLSVFRGNKIEKFDVTILGVMRKVNNGRDLILVKLGGPSMRRVTDVIAGMSGSPVYVNGKIVGAVAYGAEFTRESIGYLTPIEDMLDAWDPALPQFSQTTPLPQSVTVAGKSYNAVRIAHGESKPQPGVLTLRPLGTKVTVSGVPASRFPKVAEALGKLGLEARRGGGAGNRTDLKASPLTPGGAIAMSLATGDIDITGIGTLTYRKDKQVVAFGHPFLGIGPIDAPMYTAYIHDIEPSFAESHKIGSAVSLVGAFSQDRPFSIGGRIGARPVMVPIQVRVMDRAMRRDRIFAAKLIRHPQLTPTLAPLAAGTAIAEVHGQPGDAMATVTTTVVADEVGTVTRTNRYFDSSAIDGAATGDLDALMNLLAANPFYPLGVRSVKMEVTIEPGRRTAQVERIFLKQTRFAPGDTVEVGVVLKPYKLERVTRTLRLRIPDSAPSGIMTLTVQGGSGRGGGISLGGFTFSRGVDYSGAASIAQLVRRYQEQERNDELVAKLLLPTAAVSVQGETLSGLPPHIEAAMRGGGGTARTSNVRLERDEVKASELSDYVLSGLQALPVMIVRPGGPTDGQSRPLTPSDGVTPPGGGTTPPTGLPIGTPSPLSNGPDEDFTLGNTPEPRATTLQIPIAAGAPKPEEPVRPAAGISNPVSAVPAPAVAATVQPVGRQPGLWRLSGPFDFRTGTLDGVTVASTGEVRLAPKLTRIAESTEPFFWSLAPDGAGGVFVGSGDGGVVYRVNVEGGLAAFARTGELEVHALARGKDGIVYAGTAPHGRVYRIAGDGKPKLLLQTKEKYVFALALSASGETLYVGAGGGKARVYAVPLDGGAAKTLYESDEGSVTTLAVAPDGSLYAGTASGGLVVKIAPDGKARPQVVYDAAEPSITGLTVDKEGVVYAAAAPRGVLYRLAPGAAARVVYDKAPAQTLTNLQLGPDGTVYTASGATVVAVSPDGEIVRTTDATSDIQILSLLLAPEGRIWAATGSVGSVYALEATGLKEGQITSPVFDARATATWGTARVSATAPEGAQVYLQTRSGNTAQPDASWSDWSRALVARTGDNIASPPGRYLQWRATLEGKSDDPVLRGVEVFYRTPNQAPQVTLLAPRGGEVLRGAKTVRWSGMDPDKDALTFEVQISGDGGKTWRPLQGTPTTTTIAARPPVGAPAGNEKQAADQRMLKQVEAELDKHPEISPEMRARILADAPRQIANSTPTPAPGAAVAVPGAVGRETSVPLDTARFEDGVYQVRVVASDKPANPEGARSAEQISGEFRIVNRPPILVPFKSDITIGQDRTVRLEGAALHPAALVRAVQFRVDSDREWISASAMDGIFDGTLERWTLKTLPLTSGTHTIEVQALDEAGNAVTEKVTVQVP
jgi:hypothetical protein